MQTAGIGRRSKTGNFMASGQRIPARMTAIAITEPGGPRVLKPETRDVPMPGPGEILIRVRAAGVNRPDVQQRKGAQEHHDGHGCEKGREGGVSQRVVHLRPHHASYLLE